MRIAFFGDSFVHGTGDPTCLGWVGRVCLAAHEAGQDITCYNLGIRRETSGELRQRWAEEAARRLPAEHDPRLVFSFGVNDAAVEHGTTRVLHDDAVGNARAIMTAAAQYGPALMVGPPPLPDVEHTERIAALSRAFAAVCSDLRVPYLDVCTPLLATPHWLREAAAGDGAHPGARGYTELAALVQAWPVWQAWVAGRGNAGRLP